MGKNQALLREINKGESNSKPVHYLLMRGDENSYDDMVGIGIYQTIGKLREAYYSVVEEMEKEQKELIEEYGADDRGVQYALRHEKVKIYVFDETTEKWTWDIAPEQIFGKENGKTE